MKVNEQQLISKLFSYNLQIRHISFFDILTKTICQQLRKNDPPLLLQMNDTLQYAYELLIFLLKVVFLPF